MDLKSLVTLAKNEGASDLHLEASLPAALRVRGSLRAFGESLPAKSLLEMARSILSDEQWSHFLERRSADLSKAIAGVRCRLNIFQTARGVGFAIRLLASFQAT